MFEGDGSWSNRPPPLEYEAGPNNPWAKCVPKGRGGNKPGKGFPGFKSPKLPKPGSSGEESGGADGFLWEVGSSFAAGAAKLAAVAGSAVLTNSKGEFTGYVPVDEDIPDSWICAIVNTGSVWGGGMLAAVDPPIPSYADRVVPPALRRITLRRGTSKAAQALVDAFARLEQAALGEVEIVDRARQAGQAGDAKAYHNQVGDLWMVQTLKNDTLKVAADALRAVTREAGDLLAATKVQPGIPLRDLVAPLTLLRPQVEQIGISAAELHGTLYHFRVPSPLLEACEDYVQHTIRLTGGNAVAILDGLADDLDSVDCVDLSPFDTPPKA